MSSFKSRLHRLLRWSEQYTKTDMVYLARGGFWSVSAQFITSGAVLVLAIIVSRFLPKEVYGEYKYILAIVALLSIFSLNGLGSAIFQSVSRGYDGALQEGFWINIRWSVFTFVGAFALAAYYFILNNYTLAFGILIGGCFSPFLASANLGNAFLLGKKDFRRSALYFDIIETLLSVSALIVTVLITKNPAVLVAVYFLSNTFATMWLYRRVVRLYKPEADKTDREMFSYGKHLSLMGILNGIAGNIDQALLFHFTGPVQLAVYNFAIAIPEQTKIPLKTFNTMVQAKFVNRPTTEIRGGMQSKIFWLFISSIVFIAPYVLFAPFVYRILFPNYMDAVFYSQIYVLSMLAFSFSPASSYLIAKKKVSEQYITNISISVFQITVMAIGVIYWGLLGLIIARVLTRFANGFLSLYFLYYPIRTSEI